MIDLNSPVSNRVLAAPPKALSPSRRLLWFGLCALVLSLLFYRELMGLVRYARASESNSYILILPFFVGYLINIKRQEMTFKYAAPSIFGLVPVAFACIALAFSSYLDLPAPTRGSADQLILPIFSFVCFLMAAGFFLFGKELMKAVSFPAALLLLVCPLPSATLHSIKLFLQWSSAHAAEGLLRLFNVPLARDGFIFEVPGTVFKVAEECSGINSTLVLFIVSLVAGHLFLRSPWNRAMFTLIVIPLAIFRNGFRVFTLAVLCVYVDPTLIDSPIHHQGGPLFFGLSLIPFTLILLGMRYLEQRKKHYLQQPVAATL